MVNAAALLGSTITGEVGLRLLLCPLGSNVVIRTACCTVGIVLPVYSTFKAIERKDQSEQERWLVYWAAYGSFSLAEVFSDKILSWFPPYYYVKFAFLVWLQFPPADGSRQLYTRHLRPFLTRHQARLDQVVDSASGEIAKFVSAHQAEIQFVRALLGRFFIAAHQMVKDVIQPVQPPGRAAIEGPRRQQRRQIEDSESDHDD
ncbi:HVA22-like protein k isoform X2 [Magnolia sinica]|uniref:HVA22-like protein k isoform X2 n=1 Tax=Magnolia sinica TaxID=86752 RepID=UPI002658C568|nr:HVA22-like protein k isoform X2 [Magnolia sinica]